MCDACAVWFRAGSTKRKKKAVWKKNKLLRTLFIHPFTWTHTQCVIISAKAHRSFMHPILFLVSLARSGRVHPCKGFQKRICAPHHASSITPHRSSVRRQGELGICIIESRWDIYEHGDITQSKPTTPMSNVLVDVPKLPPRTVSMGWYTQGDAKAFSQ